MRKKIPKVLNTRKNRDSQYTHSKFELPNLNKFIYENMQNRERSTDYNLLYRISKTMSNELKIKDRHINEITKPISEKQTKEVTLQFFKELDQELYEKAKKLLMEIVILVLICICWMEMRTFQKQKVMVCLYILKFLVYFQEMENQLYICPTKEL